MSTLKSANAPVDNTQASGLVGSPEKNTISAGVFSPVTTNSNPGSLEEIHRKCREIFPMCFDGARMMLTKAMSSHFQVSPVKIFYERYSFIVRNSLRCCWISSF